MLGDDVPWLVPLLFISLLLWPMSAQFEKISASKGKWIKLIHNFLPLLLVILMILDRLIAVFSNDVSYADIAKYNAGSNPLNSGAWMTFARGDGLSELILMILLIFSLSVEKLPSISQSPQHIKTLVRYRVMSFVALLTLLSFAVFFPDSAYLDADSITAQSTWPNAGMGPFWIGLVTLALIIIAAELFAVSTIIAVDSGLSNLALKAKLKLVAIFPLLMYIFKKIDFLGTTEVNIWLDLEHYYTVIFISIFLHMAISFATILEPAQRLDSKLGAGGGRTKSLIITSLSAFIFLAIISLIFARSLDIFAGDGEALMVIWYVFAIIALCVASMFLPTIGFDASARPELWWVRFSLSISPLLLAAFTPYVLILLPAIWFSLALTLAIPWLVEEDVKNSNSKLFYASFTFIITYSVFIVPTLLSFPGIHLAVTWLSMPLIPLLMSSVLLHQMSKQNPETGKV